MPATTAPRSSPRSTTQSRRTMRISRPCIRSNFTDARDHFAEASVDLLHIDGQHHYEDAHSDFETWRPKLSDRAVVLFHDINEYGRDFGVHRLWGELVEAYPGLRLSPWPWSRRARCRARAAGVARSALCPRPGPADARTGPAAGSRGWDRRYATTGSGRHGGGERFRGPGRGTRCDSQEQRGRAAAADCYSAKCSPGSKPPSPSSTMRLAKVSGKRDEARSPGCPWLVAPAENGRRRRNPPGQDGSARRSRPRPAPVAPAATPGEGMVAAAIEVVQKDGWAAAMPLWQAYADSGLRVLRGRLCVGRHRNPRRRSVSPRFHAARLRAMTARAGASIPSFSADTTPSVRPSFVRPASISSASPTATSRSTAGGW